MKNILVTGSKGQVGQELQILASQFPNFNFIFVDIDELDITDGKAVQEFFPKYSFSYCINCAAYTAVDKAEANADIAKKVNVDGVYHLAQSCLLHQIAYIQLSTDYVYHNDWNTPLTEDAPTNPQSVYALTKLQGDEMAQKIMPSATIIRTSWVYSSFGHNFVKTMLRLGKERDALNIVVDQIGTPTYAHDLALGILQMIDKVEKDDINSSALSGIFHFSNEGVTSWYDFATAIFDIENIDCTTSPIPTSDYPTPAKRPPFSVLDKTKIKNTFGLDIPHWRVALKNCLEVLKKQE